MSDRIIATAIGSGFGVVIGVLLCFGPSNFSLDDDLWLRAMLSAVIGSLTVGGLSFFYGAPVIEWLKEHWSEFWT